MTARRRPKRLEGPAAFDIRSLHDREAVDYLRQCIRRWLVRLQVPTRELDDIEQDVITTAVLVAGRYDPAHGSLQAWMEGIATRTVLDYRKRWRRKLSRLVPEEEGPTTPPAAPDLNPEQAVHAKRTLQTLGDAVPEPLQTCFLMHAEGYTRPEIAEETGLSEGAVAYRLEKLGAIRDDTAAGMGEEPKGGSKVRFGLSPLFAALLSQWQTGAVVPARHGPPSPDEEGAVKVVFGQPRPPRRGPVSPRVVATMAAALAALLAAPLGWATLDARRPVPFLSKDRSVASPGEPVMPEERQALSADRRPAEASPSATHRPAVPSPLRASPAKPAVQQLRSSKTTSHPPRTGSDVLLRLAAGAAHGGANEAAKAALREHARRSPDTDAEKRADLANQARSLPDGRPIP